MLLVFILIATFFSVVGQLALKNGMHKIASAAPQGLVLRQMILSPWVVGGLGAYGLGVVSWLFALSREDVSYVYPFAALSYVGIFIGSYFLYHEHINRLRLIGILIIIAGVVIAGLST